MTAPLQPAALEQLADEFRRLDESDERPRSRARFVLLAVIAALGLAATAGAAAVVITEGVPFPDASPHDLRPEDRPVPGTLLVAQARAQDPAGGPPWAMRTTRSETGLICETVGRLVNGRLGLLKSGTFRPIALYGPGSCHATSGRPLNMTVSSFGPPVDRSVLHGVASPHVASIELSADGTTTTVHPAADGSYLAVFQGLPTIVRTVHFDDGRTQVFDPRR